MNFSSSFKTCFLGINLASKCSMGYGFYFIKVNFWRTDGVGDQNSLIALSVSNVSCGDASPLAKSGSKVVVVSTHRSAEQGATISIYLCRCEISSGYSTVRV